MEVDEEDTNGEGIQPEPSKHEIGTEDIKKETEEEEDPIVHEIPIFLSKGIKNLYLFQYPVRPAHMPYDGVEVSSAKVRPNNQQVELELMINTQNPNYDRSKGEQISLNVDGAASKETDTAKVFQAPVMNKQVLVGSSAVSKSGRYAVGLLNDNELHLTSVKGVLSIRPSLGYLDKADSRAKSEGRAASEGEENIEQGDVKPEAVTVKFARGDPQRNKKFKERSYDYQKKLQEEEPWLHTRFNQMKSGAWDRESQKMFCSAMETDVKEMDLASKDYLLSLKDGSGS